MHDAWPRGCCLRARGYGTTETRAWGEHLKEDEKGIWSSEKEFTVDALELSDEEGRGKLRKAMGRSKHPEIRRCPNGVTRPAGGRPCMPEHIGYASNTWGTEPSQYPEEKKSTEIPKVAASEMGRA